ncbi:VIT family protein [Asticcacaulis sp. ZE23SCel15]|uniref:VIT1/CCC1 transporter family protein n=1 Tax=Asticcacaulis sp. ZE23SCel15 TaxID=3059027 RepID=UPI00265DAD43|nr:VIT family protein [Asticcacaulis sp. ZE23SCel15]WKL57203.1 VIT family protein [Asticcacaulis sp. ZE23SCel15]
MTDKHSRFEMHFISRIGWLRAAVLGANDGIVSTASLIVGVAASPADKATILLTGVAALVAGALSMAAGEYVSVSSQADTEAADLARETQELRDFPQAEEDELTHIYVERGLERDLARQVAVQLMQKDALKAHLRDELGMSDHSEARPVQAALTSAVTFAVGAFLPLLAMILSPRDLIVPAVSVCALLFLAVLGALGAISGGANMTRAVVRVTFWGALALAVTAGIGRLFGAVV